MKNYIKKILRENLESHDIDSMLNQLKSNIDCDCCKYFDMDSINIYGGFEHPIYYIINLYLLVFAPLNLALFMQAFEPNYRFDKDYRLNQDSLTKNTSDDVSN